MKNIILKKPISKIDLEIILDSLDNHLEYDKKVSRDKGYITPLFRAETRKRRGNLFNYLSIVKAVFFCFLPILLPLFSKYLVRLSCFENKNSNTINFFTGHKSKEIINHNENTKHSYISLSGFGKRMVFRYSYIISLYRLNRRFLVKYKNDKWFYEAVLWLPELLVFYIYLKKNSDKSINLTNHYDRWAYIASSTCKAHGSNLSLYQHGIVDNKFIPRNKLPMVSTLYVFSESQYCIFREHICDNIRSHIILTPKIQLKKIKKNRGEKLVFLVGHGHKSVVEDLYWLAELLSDSTIRVFIKPHPAYLAVFEKFDWMNTNAILLSESDEFPDVDYVVHSGSTLAIEYEATSKRVVCFDLNVITKHKIFEVISQ